MKHIIDNILNVNCKALKYKALQNSLCFTY